MTDPERVSEQPSDGYHRRPNGIFVPPQELEHREHEYASENFDLLLSMQQRHFWYRGRHRFLWHAAQRQLQRCGRQSHQRIVDLGGGCGGWIRYLHDRSRVAIDELAIADSSLRALEYAKGVLPDSATRYHIDLLSLQWKNRWDVSFLLDVLEHIPEDEAALSQIRDALVPGGMLFITTPALKQFWTSNDDLVHHVRRYSRHDFQRLVEKSGFELLDARYFMFFLSPLLLASRWMSRPAADLSESERQERLAAEHRIPNPITNTVFAGVFAAETPLGHVIRFPWGTSILAVLRKPES